MAEKPILFNGEMVRAILDGRKTQTRRVIKPQPIIQHNPYDSSVLIVCWEKNKNHKVFTPPSGLIMDNPYAKEPGDLLWVRETWATLPQWDDTKPSMLPINGVPVYYTDDDFGEYRKRPSIFMPRWASRITLRVNNVRVERVQNISEADAKAEGVSFWWDIGDGERQLESGWEAKSENVPEDKRDYRMGFHLLWDTINARRGYSWKSNPWVWVVEFELANK